MKVDKKTLTNEAEYFMISVFWLLVFGYRAQGSDVQLCGTKKLKGRISKQTQTPCPSGAQGQL